MIPALRSRFDRLKVSSLRHVGRSSLPQWIIENTRSPSNPTRPWSFLNHEYQQGILSCEAEYITIKKAAQVGASEMSLRMALALVSLYQNTNWMYVLPSLGFARKFSTTRVDPVIEQSPSLLRDLSKEVNSSEMKRLGSSFLYFAGAQTTRQAISVPAKGLILDERDFSSQSILTSFFSRLGHNKEGDSVVIQLSTPTLPGYSIDKLYGEGSKGVYMVLHTACNQWVVLNPLMDIILPGWGDDSLVNFSKRDLDDPKLKVKQAFVQCPSCHKPIAQDNLVDPSKREWVHHHPDREHKSFYVSPLDVPAVNTPTKILSSVLHYNRHADWINFSLGVAYQDTENAIAMDVVKRSATAQVRLPAARAQLGCVIGSDVGKISHMLVGKRNGNYLDVIHAERVKQDGSGSLVRTWKQRVAEYGAWRIVVDAGPDISSPQELIETSAWNQAWACYFTRGKASDRREYQTRDDDQMISAARTRVLDKTVRMLNSGEIRLPTSHSEMPLIIKHLEAMKRVDRVSDTTGEKIEHWASTTAENHYFFALVYLVLADDLAGSSTNVVPLPVANLMKKVQRKTSVGR